VIDTSKFSRNDASAREKNIYNQYTAKEAVVIQGIIEELKNINALNVGELSDEYNDYMFFVYDLLGSEGILDKNAIDMEDSVYVRWTKEQVSLREFLQRAISENWINVNILDNDAKYANSDEIYAAIMDRLEVLLVNNKNLSERIYYYMIYNGEISPYDICYILYDQGCLEEDDAYYGLEAGEFDTFSYVIRQIEALNITPAMLALDPCSGALTITDTKTGKVLAMVTYPSYDNNKLSGEIDTAYWNKINNDDSQPLFNRATQALTAPGSTFKLCTSVCGLNEGLITPGTYIYDNIYFEEVTPSPKCYVAPASHGSVNVSTALQESCNYFYFYLGYQLGCDTGTYNSALALDKIENYAVQLGLGMKSGVEIEETSPRVSNTDSVRTAIGQGTNGYASVHMTRYVNTIANRGDNYQLTLLDKIVNKSGMLLVQQDPVISNHLEMSSTNWDAVQTGMRLVVTSGTASSFFTDLGVTVAGKTGTAEENIYRSNHAAFVGYAPYENPEVSFSCMIRNCDSTSYPGGVLCDTLKYYFGETSFEDVLNAKVENTIQGFHSE
ncbi:MAG: hypothetical protein HUJ75_02920, partial [Parasporobacterium sp.]|nr:hypothetical protein [Parasporobacterium sp.]